MKEELEMLKMCLELKDNYKIKKILREVIERYEHRLKVYVENWKRWGRPRKYK